MPGALGPALFQRQLWTATSLATRGRQQAGERRDPPEDTTEGGGGYRTREKEGGRSLAENVHPNHHRTCGSDQPRWVKRRVLIHTPARIARKTKSSSPWVTTHMRGFVIARETREELTADPANRVVVVVVFAGPGRHSEGAGLRRRLSYGKCGGEMGWGVKWEVCKAACHLRLDIRPFRPMDGREGCVAGSELPLLLWGVRLR